MASASVSSKSGEAAARRKSGLAAGGKVVEPDGCEAATSKRREVLIRQPSYCKILNDLKGTEAKMKREPDTEQVTTSAGDGDGDESDSSQTGARSAAAAAPSSSSSGVQTISINGQQYQIVSPSVEGLQTITVGTTGGGGGSAASGGSGSQASSSSPTSGSVVQYAPVSQNGQTVFIPGTVGAGLAAAAAASSGSTSAVAGSSLLVGEEASRKREIRLLKNREAARECRNKKKEYIKCLENRVAVLENQNKALIEELKSLKELYTGHKN